MWKQLNENYSISELGEIKNIKTNKVLKGDLNSKGYKRVNINKRRQLLHRLIAGLYIPNVNNYPQVNHINGNKLDNSVKNLEWCTNQYNNLHSYTNGRLGGKTKLSLEALFIILNTDKKAKDLAVEFSVSKPTIYAVRQGLNTKRIGM